MSLVQDIQDHIQTIKKQKQLQKDNRFNKESEIDASINMLDNFRKNNKEPTTSSLSNTYNSSLPSKYASTDRGDFNHTVSFNNAGLSTDSNIRASNSAALNINKIQQSEENKCDSSEIRSGISATQKLNSQISQENYSLKKNIQTIPQTNITQGKASSRIDQFYNEIDNRGSNSSNNISLIDSRGNNNYSSTQPRMEVQKELENFNKNKDKGIKSFLSKGDEKGFQVEQRKNEKKAQLIEMLSETNNSKFGFSRPVDQSKQQPSTSATKVRHQIKSIIGSFEPGNHLFKEESDGKPKLLQMIEDKNFTQRPTTDSNIKLTDPMSLLSASKYNKTQKASSLSNFSMREEKSNLSLEKFKELNSE